MSFGRPPDSEDQFFAPRVTATCRAGIMTVKGKNMINFAEQYYLAAFDVAEVSSCAISRNFLYKNK